MEHLCILKKEGSGYSLELSFDSIKAALDAALEILAFADADCYLAGQDKQRSPDYQPTYKQPSEFPDMLRIYRVTHGYTQKEFGALLGVSQQTLCSWETGSVTPRRATEAAIREKLRKGEFAND